MSGTEAVAITGTVAAVLSTFEHGQALVKKIREKRALQGAVPPPPALEQSLIKGPRAVREACESGVETYGPAFHVENDRIALDAFKDILINLQGTILQHLFTAQEDDTINDFSLVLNASNMGRVKSVNALNDLYVRMGEASPTGPIQDWMSQQGSPPQESPRIPRIQQASPNIDGYLTSPLPTRGWNGQRQRTMTEATSSTMDMSGNPLTSMTTASSQVIPRYTSDVTSTPANHSHSSSHATNTTNTTNGSEEAELSKSPAPTKKSFRHMFSSPKPRTDPFLDDPRRLPVNYERPDSVSSDGRSLYCSSSGASFVSGSSPETRSYSHMVNPPRKPIFDGNGNKIPFHESPSPEHRKRLNNRPKPKRAIASESSASSARPPLTTSKSSSRKFSLHLGSSKSPKEGFAGFCKGAYLMRTGNDGMKLRNQSVSMTGQNNYWACSNSMCCFEGPAVQKTDEHKKTSFTFDDAIHEAYGVKYRWTFLAKSHTELGNSKAGFEYLCVFCAGQGAPCFKVKGERKFLEHVATHQGQTPDKLKMFLFKYVVGRKASDWENFDVNLPLPTAMELETLETPAELEAPKPTLAEMEAPLASPRWYKKEASGSGLGIHLGAENNAAEESRLIASRRVNMHSTDTGSAMQANFAVERQNNSSRHQLLGQCNHDTTPGNNHDYEHGKGATSNHNRTDTADTSNSTLEKSWNHVRDSVYSMHPPPLFARKPVPAAAIRDHEQEQVQSQQCNGHEQEQKSLLEAPEGEPYEHVHIDRYNESGVDGYPIHRPRMLVPQDPNPWRTSYATLAPESQKASVIVPDEFAPQIPVLGTPDLSHPGTKWMD